ncbi:MAG: K+/H+ antiporter subunit F, partial [Pseudomonadales bacterium]|nr:K+/H+ antiporter subunit F [Pseudomonadales bacterium]
MLDTVVLLCLGIICAALLLTFARLIKGPDLPDRILALDTLYINAIALIMLLGLYLDSNLFFEAALL